MNSYQLEIVLTKDRNSLEKFIGVFPMDLLPNDLPAKPFCLVVNSAPSSSQGEHWLAVFVNTNGHGELFDSYGHPADFYDQRLEVFLEKNCLDHSFMQENYKVCGPMFVGNIVYFIC
ncbi:MAG: hypothetical protein VX790_04620 [Bacteroidota bacterium]|nr:hypothetical protein [Bacteroidota bacterium]